MKELREKCIDNDTNEITGVIAFDNLIEWIDHPEVFEQLACYVKEANEQGSVDELKKEFVEKGIYVSVDK